MFVSNGLAQLNLDGFMMVHDNLFNNCMKEIDQGSSSRQKKFSCRSSSTSLKFIMQERQMIYNNCLELTINFLAIQTGKMSEVVHHGIHLPNHQFAHVFFYDFFCTDDSHILVLQ